MIYHVDRDDLLEMAGQRLGDADHLASDVLEDWDKRGGTIDAAAALRDEYAKNHRFVHAYYADTLLVELELREEDMAQDEEDA